MKTLAPLSLCWTLALATAGCGNDTDKQICSKQNTRFETFVSDAKQRCAVEPAFKPGTQQASTCETTVRSKCNDADKASIESFLTCLEKLDTQAANACASLSTEYESCFNQHASKARTSCFETFFGAPSVQ